MEKAQVLIVENDGIIAMVIKSQLKQLGYGVNAIVGYGEEAIAKVKENKPDVVLMDIVLKGDIDGIEAADEIRTQFDIPIIFLTAFADKERLKRAKLTYPFGFILKPFQNKDLEVTIEMALYVAKVDAERKQAEEALCQAHDELAQRVEERTAELAKVNELLKKEIDERKRTEVALRLYEEIIENMAEGVNLIRTSDSVIVYTNPQFKRMFGYGSEELKGKHVSIVNAPTEKTPEETAEEIIQCLKEKGAWSGEVLNIKKDGTPFWCRASVSTFNHHEYGEVWISVREDITERKQAEEALRKSEDQLRMITDNIPAYVSYVDSDLYYRFVNKPYEKLYNKPRAEIIGKHAREVLGETYYDKAREKIQSVLSGQKILFETPFLYKEKQLFLTVAYVPNIDEKGVTKGYFILANDITERMRAEEALRESEERFRHLSEGTFEAILLHNEGVILQANEQYFEMFGYEPEELVGKDAISLLTTSDSAKFIKEQISSDNLGPYEVTGLKKDGTEFPMEVRVKLAEYHGQKIRMAAIRDLTELKKGEAALKKRTKDLELKTKSLEELNTAIKVLLKKREEDKIEVEQSVMTNVRELISPYFDKINETNLNDYQKTFLNILESNLNEIVSPFTRKLSLKYLSLTPKEIQIVNMIKIGYPSKKIAKIMKISPRTVDTHRKNIRSKIGLGQKRANLRSHLLAHEQ